MADQEVIKHVKAAIETARDKKMDWKHKLKEILLEVSIIVFAVSLSIWLHGWAEGLKDRKEEREFLVGLKQDLMMDLEEMKSDRASNLKRYRVSQYLEGIGEGGKLNMDSIEYNIRIFSSWSSISPRISRFEALKGSGRLSIIEDKDLLNRITELYAKDFPWIIGLNDNVTKLEMNSLMPYLATHLQMDSHFKGTNWDQLLRESQTRILISQLGEMANNNAAGYERGIEHCEKIIEEIGKEVK